MRTDRVRVPNGLVAIVVAIALGSCDVLGAIDSTPPPSRAVAPGAPSPVPAGSLELEVRPATAVGYALSGSKFVFLVAVRGGHGGAARIRASAEGASVQVDPESLLPGVVGEVAVIPEPVDAPDVDVTVEVTASLEGAVRRASRTITVHNCLDVRSYEADKHLAPFLRWLASKRPELGISPSTTWEAIPASWVVGGYHFLYFSDAWELDLEWQVAPPPDDWLRISLRERWVEMAPSLAFEIPSDNAGLKPHAIEPPDAVWR